MAASGGRTDRAAHPAQIPVRPCGQHQRTPSHGASLGLCRDLCQQAPEPRQRHKAPRGRDTPRQPFWTMIPNGLRGARHPGDGGGFPGVYPNLSASDRNSQGAVPRIQTGNRSQAGTTTWAWLRSIALMIARATRSGGMGAGRAR